MHFPISTHSGGTSKLSVHESIGLFGFLTGSCLLVAGGAAIVIYACTVTGGDFQASAAVFRRSFAGGDGWMWGFFWMLSISIWGGAGLSLIFHPREAGRFVGGAVIECGEDEEALRLSEDLAFRDASGRLWSAPCGSVFRGEALPSSVWKILGHPFVGAHRDAAIIHEHYCRMRAGLPGEVHQMFYEGCRSRGVPEPIARLARWELEQHGPSWGHEPSVERGLPWNGTKVKGQTW